jgi:hypothetical protein
MSADKGQNTPPDLAGEGAQPPTFSGYALKNASLTNVDLGTFRGEQQTVGVQAANASNRRLGLSAGRCGRFV